MKLYTVEELFTVKCQLDRVLKYVVSQQPVDLSALTKADNDAMDIVIYCRDSVYAELMLVQLNWSGNKKGADLTEDQKNELWNLLNDHASDMEGEELREYYADGEVDKYDLAGLEQLRGLYGKDEN